MKAEMYDPKTMAEAIIKAGGIKTAACKLIGCSRETLRKYIEKYPELEEAVRESKSQLLDVAEAQLHKNIRNGHASSIFFYLKTIGKNRGYTERQEVSGIDGAPVESKVTIEFIDAPDKPKSK